MSKNEIRNNATAELRVASEGGNKLTGYAAVFDKPSLMLFEGGRSFIEVIKRGAFARSIADNREIKADIGHESNRVIGRRSKGTLSIAEDQIGLHVEIEPGNDSDGTDARAKVARGDWDQMSFEFRVADGGEQWTKQQDGTWLRTLSNLELLRVSVVAEPAYPDTSIAVRSLEQQEAQAEPEVVPEEPKAEGKPLQHYQLTLKLKNMDGGKSGE